MSDTGSAGQRFQSWIHVALCMAAVQWATGALGQDGPAPSREEIAAALKNAEQLRSAYRIRAAITWHYEVEGQTDRRIVFTRLSDGQGRFRREKWNESPDRIAELSRELTCWNGAESRGDVHRIRDRSGDPHMVLLAPESAGNDYMDEIENALGLGIAYPVTDKFPRLSPSRAIANSATPISIERIRDRSEDLVRVRIDGPWGGQGNTYIYDFDPQRQWLIRAIEIRVYQTTEQHDQDLSPSIKKYKTSRTDQIDGVWVPREVEMINRMAESVEPDARWEEYRATLELESIELDPHVSDADFTFGLEGMPDDTDVVDKRLGVSYKLGQALIYADGALHEVAAPIDHEIDAQEMETLLASSKAFIDPELAKIDLKPVGGESVKWIRRVGGLAGAAFLIGAGITLYRRRG